MSRLQPQFCIHVCLTLSVATLGSASGLSVTHLAPQDCTESLEVVRVEGAQIVRGSFYFENSEGVFRHSHVAPGLLHGSLG